MKIEEGVKVTTAPVAFVKSHSYVFEASGDTMAYARQNLVLRLDQEARLLNKSEYGKGATCTKAQAALYALVSIALTGACK